MEKLFGFLFRYSEQELEGNYLWSFQDDRYTSSLPYFLGHCRKCGELMGTRTDRSGNYERALIELRKVGLFEKACRPDEHEEEIVRQFNYKGWYPLQNGDELTVCDKNRPLVVIWRGIIKFKRGNHPKDKQVGVRKKTWLRWFAGGYPAILIPIYPRKV